MYKLSLSGLGIAVIKFKTLMKCPNCQFVCSELRDICPKCLLDFRPYKRSLGLQITFPDLSYAELTAKVMKKPLAENSAEEQEANLLSSLKEFGRDVISALSPANLEEQPLPREKETTPEMQNIATLCKDAEEEIQHTTPIVIPEAAPRNAPTIIDFSDSQEDLTEILDQMIGETEIEVEAVKPGETDNAIEFDFVFDDQPGCDNQGEDPPVLSESAMNDQGSDLPTTQLEIAISLPDETGIIEMSDTPERPSPSELQVTTSETNWLFEQALNEIRTFTETPTCELELLQFNRTVKSEEIDLLFDLTAEEITNPEKIKRYTKVVPTSTEQSVTSNELNRQLKAVEKAISSPLLSLKAPSPRKSSDQTSTYKSDEHDAETVTIPKPATIFQRVYCLLLDLIVIAILALFTTIVFGFVDGTLPAEILIDPTAIGIVETLTLLGDFLFVLIIGLIAYPLFAYLTTQQTIGMKIANIQMVDYHGKQPSQLQLIIRALSWPFALLFCGIIGRQGKDLLHDRAAALSLVSMSNPKSIQHSK